MSFLGMRGNDDWVTDQRPKNWRETILFLYPNGRAPLTAVMAKLKSQPTDDPEFNWWTKALPAQAGAITNIYTDTGMSAAYTSGGVAGETLYVKCSAATIAHVRIGHTLLLRDASDPDVDVLCKVTARSANGASSKITVTLLEDDDNSSNGDLSDADRLLVVGNLNEEGANIPSALAYDPTKIYNYTQIFRTPLDITRTAKKTHLRTGDQYKEMKREALELHAIEMEKAFIFGVPTENTGSGGKPERTTGGLIHYIRTYASDNVVDYTLDATYSAQAWTTGGETWLDNKLEQIFRYGSTEKLALCGSGALLGLSRLAKAGGQINLNPGAPAYGIKMVEWITPFGTLYLKTHPLFSYETTLRNSMLVVDTQNMMERPLDNTFFKKDTSEREGGQNAYDATKEEYLTETGFEVWHPEAFGWLTGVGQANVV